MIHSIVKAALRQRFLVVMLSVFLMIAGIVSIPGMTTGQLLAGADVLEALRYQILVYLGITATAALSTLILLGLQLRRAFTPAHQLRLD